MVKKYNIRVNGKAYEVEVEEMGSHQSVQQGQTIQTVSQVQQTPQTQQPKPVSKPAQSEPKKETAADQGAHSSIDAPMSGLVIDVKVKKGDNVKQGDKLLVLEAMKMENDIVSDVSGIIDEVHCKKGDNVETGETLITIS
ncbi:MAG TPA: biotin/lipoyl-binding protein [Thermotogota bacterium]|nr:biotin/lipoyl-binding protein [Thermotogota bacterium]HRW33781.1 biotin/lipoyl-binding protein [Thermotogota bacterium]